MLCLEYNLLIRLLFKTPRGRGSSLPTHPDFWTQAAHTYGGPCLHLRSPHYIGGIAAHSHLWAQNKGRLQVLWYGRWLLLVIFCQVSISRQCSKSKVGRLVPAADFGDSALVSPSRVPSLRAESASDSGGFKPTPLIALHPFHACGSKYCCTPFSHCFP